VLVAGLSTQLPLFFAATTFFAATAAFFLAVLTGAGTASESDAEQTHAGSPKERSTIGTVAGMLHG